MATGNRRVRHGRGGHRATVHNGRPYRTDGVQHLGAAMVAQDGVGLEEDPCAGGAPIGLHPASGHDGDPLVAVRNLDRIGNASLSGAACRGRRSRRRRGSAETDGRHATTAKLAVILVIDSCVRSISRRETPVIVGAWASTRNVGLALGASGAAPGHGAASGLTGCDRPDLAATRAGELSTVDSVPGPNWERGIPESSAEGSLTPTNGGS